jgi:hypothetical protein
MAPVQQSHNAQSLTLLQSQWTMDQSSCCLPLCLSTRLARSNACQSSVHLANCRAQA